MKSHFTEGVVVDNRHWTESLYSLRIDAGNIPFKAGQFGRLALNIDGERIARPYSFVNSPDDPILEFYSIIVNTGPLSPRLATLKTDDKVLIANSGNGFLVLDEVPDSKHLWLLATGTGIGPFLSIIKSPTPWQRFEKVILIHAVRTVNELTYQETIEQCTDQHSDQFVSIPFVSREPTDFAMPGRIPAAIKNNTLEERAGCLFSAEHAQVMLCGNPAMVKEVTEVLQARGLAKNRRRTPGHITVENYW